MLIRSALLASKTPMGVGHALIVSTVGGGLLLSSRMAVA
jgi:hypothetical protein